MLENIILSLIPRVKAELKSAHDEVKQLRKTITDKNREIESLTKKHDNLAKELAHKATAEAKILARLEKEFPEHFAEANNAEHR